MAETIKKMQQKVDIITLCGETVTADDAVVAGQGTAARGAVVNHRDVIITEEGKITFVPFHAICKVEVTITSEEVEKPEDTVCTPVEEESGEEGNG